MADMPVSDALQWWIKRAGHRPADPPAAYFKPDGEPRKAAPSPEAQKAAEEIDVAEVIRMRQEQTVKAARTLRRACGSFSEQGEDHAYLGDHAKFVPSLPRGIGEDLAVAIFA
jgi:hypothetical protein